MSVAKKNFESYRTMFIPIDVLKQNGVLVLGIILLVAFFGKALFRQFVNRLQGRPTTPSTQSKIPAGITIKKKNILSRGEMAFYRTLKAAVGGHYDVYAQIPVWALVDFASANRNEKLSFTNQINQKRVDFVLVNPASLETETVIELDDRSHERNVRKERDSFLDAVLARAGIPIVRIAAAATYNEEELRNKLVSMKDQLTRKEG
jgi:very-short-patch-repair endonuclease